MRQAFQKFIKESQLFLPNDKILVAVSGGADSVALCYLLYDFQINFIMAHCNFNLRGEESDGDEKFVIDLAKKLNTQIFVQGFNVEEEVKKTGKSIQMVARDLRYSWFNELKNLHNCQYIATAHHKNDSLETILLNITRGTGIAGLHGIQAKSNDVIRPLLFASKSEIIAFVKAENIHYREDSSNSINKYHRNLIRNKVVPELKTINPSLEETILTFIEKISNTEEILFEQLEKFKTNRITRKGNTIYFNIQDLKEEQGLLLKLFNVLDDYNFSFKQCKFILNSIEKQSGKVFLSHTHQLVKDRESLIISPIQNLSENFSIVENIEEVLTADFRLDLKTIDISQFQLSKEKEVAQLDYDKINFPLKMRHWEKGDTFHPLGMNRKKKLSDFFIDLKIPLPQKDKQFVLLSLDKIIWVVGERINDHFKITSGTKKVLVIKQIPL